MASLFSSHAVIDPTAHIGENTSIGAYSVIGPDVHIGSDCSIGNHVVIHAGTRIGDGVRIDDHTVIGKQPMRSPRSAITSGRTFPPAHIGNQCLIGAHVVIYAGCELGHQILVADLASIREEVTIGDLTIIGRGVAIENKCQIGRRCKIETNVYITAYSTIDDDVFIAPGALTSNDNFLGRTEERFKHFKGVTLRRGARIGVGAVILPGRTVAEETVVGAGAVLTHDTEPAMIYVGVPARPLRPVPKEQLLTKPT